MNRVVTIAAFAGLSSVALAGTPSTVADFGLVVGTASASATIPAFEVDVFWISFDLDGSETYLDITTAFGSGLTDTEIGVFDSAGNVLGSNDDHNLIFGLQSLLSYGTGSGMAYDGGNSAGGDGAMLGAGTYYVAFGGFDTTFSSNFGASSTYFDFDDAPMTLSIFTNNVPTPGAVSLLAIGGLAASRRRRS